MAGLGPAHFAFVEHGQGVHPARIGAGWTLASQASTVVTKLDGALAKIKAMKYPFALYYSDASCKVAIDALGELDDTLGEMAETLKAYAGNETVEKQCQVINENYVDNVVVATYRLLADNAQKLYQSIVNIKQ